jgi:hypothetical protein
MIRLRNVASLIRDQLNRMKNGEDRGLRAQLPNTQVVVNIRILLIDFNMFFPVSLPFYQPRLAQPKLQP